MNNLDVKRTAFAMPLTSPAFPPAATLGMGQVVHDYLA